MSRDIVTLFDKQISAFTLDISKSLILSGDQVHKLALQLTCSLNSLNFDSRRGKKL